jgi:hypothetical protein
MNTNDKIKLGTSLLKALVAGAAKNRSQRSNETTKQNTNVSGCGGCSRSDHK